jgi:response regulator RpfG family c-di-GMP phosphodiesterase
MQSEKLSVLFVDDEPHILESLKELFSRRYKVFTSTSGEEALEIVKNNNIAIVMSDQRMPGMKGVEVLRAVRELSPNTMRVLLTGFADVDAILDSVNVGEVFRYVRKPWDVNHLNSILLLAENTFLSKLRAAEVSNKTTPKMSDITPKRTTLPPSVLQELRRRQDAEERFFQKVSECLKQGIAPEKLLEGISGRPKLLVVDDEPAVLNALSELLSDRYEVLTSQTADEALQVLEQNVLIAALISDQRMPSKTGADLLIEVSSIAPLIPKILITAYTDVEDVVRLINEGQIHRYIQKPWDSRKLKTTISEAVELYRERLVVYLAEREKFGSTFLQSLEQQTPQDAEQTHREGKPANPELANKLRALSDMRKKKS